MSKKLTAIVAVILILALGMALTACGTVTIEVKEDNVYKVGNGTLTLKEITTDVENSGIMRGLANNNGWMVLIFSASGDLTTTDIDNFEKSIQVDECKFNTKQEGLGEAVSGAGDDVYKVDTSMDVMYVYETPDNYEPSLDKVHISADKAE